MAANGRSQLLKSSLGTALATLASRLLGLLRVSLEARVLGGGEICSGWHLAVAIPNLFRRLLGEGALGTALIPIVAETEKTKGPEVLRRELAVIFSLLGVLLAVIVVVAGGGAWLLERATWNSTGFFGTERMLTALNADPDAAPEQILKNIRIAVDDFVKDAEQFDDLTMLCMEYKGKGRMEE